MKNGLRIVSGVETHNLDDAVWDGVTDSYYRSAYPFHDDEELALRQLHHISANDVKSGIDEFRFGSVITVNSKLLVCDFRTNLLHFDFYANADPHELETTQQQTGITEQAIQDDFQRRITTFLSGLGIAREVTNCIDLK